MRANITKKKIKVLQLVVAPEIRVALKKKFRISEQTYLAYMKPNNSQPRALELKAYAINNFHTPVIKSEKIIGTLELVEE